MPETSQHIYNAQRGNSGVLLKSPFFLNYSKGKGKRNWYNKTSACGPGARALFLLKMVIMENVMSFHILKLLKVGVEIIQVGLSIKLINQGEGSSQGGKYNIFLQRCKLKTRNTKKNRFLAVGLPSFPFSMIQEC